MSKRRKKSASSRLSKNQEWFILLKAKPSGPYSMVELQSLSEFNPDSLVWKEGFQNWIKARFVKELEPLFVDEKEKSGDEEPAISSAKSGECASLIEALTISQDPSPLFLWLVLILIVTLYTFYLMHS